MKRILYLSIIALFILGCEKEKEKDLNRLSINLITDEDPTFFSKTVILFENDDYLIKINFDTYIDSFPYDMYGYDEIKVQLTEDSNKQLPLLMTDYLYQANDSIYILAYHLENGSCLILDKRKNEIIQKIEMEKYMEGEAMMSTVGRRFYIYGQIFLVTVDLIS